MTTLHFYLMLSLWILSCTRLINSYGNGLLPGYVCDTMKPSHGFRTKPQSGPAPYQLIPSATMYQPGDTLQVTLTGEAGEMFRGFFIQARLTSDDSTRIGVFSTGTAPAQTICYDEAASHTNKRDKTSVTLTWTAPLTAKENFRFKASVVMRYNTYWMDIYSETITFGAQRPPSTFVELSSQHITQSPTDPPLITTSQTRMETTASSISTDNGQLRNITNTEVSTDPAFIVINASTVETTGKRGLIETTFEDSLSEYTSKISITKSSPNKLITSTKLTTPGTAKQISTTKYTTLDSTVVSTNQVVKRSTTMYTTPGRTRKNYTATSTTRPMAKTSVPAVNHACPTVNYNEDARTTYGITLDLSNCGFTKGCFRSPVGCHGEDCELVATWMLVTQGTAEMAFELQAKGSGWVGLGFSEDKLMGDDYVIICILDDESTLEVKWTFNEGYRNEDLLDEDIKGPFYNITTYYSDEIITCIFKHPVTYRRHVRSDSGDFAMHRDFTLLLASGETSEGYPLQHTVPPLVSDVKVRINKDFQDIGAKRTNYKAYKAHGILMVITWLFLIPSTLIFARFFKNGFSDKTWCGVKIWFAIHRSINIVALILGVTSFMVIFATVGRFSKIGASEPAFWRAHAPLGIIVTAALVMNPLLSFLRPLPTHPRRKYWNWAHWSIGYGAWILSVITLFFGVNLPKSDLFASEKSMVLGCMIAVVCLIIATWFLLEAEQCGMKKKCDGINIDLGALGKSVDTSPTQRQVEIPCTKTTYTAFGIYVWLMTVFVTLIIVGISV